MSERRGRLFEQAADGIVTVEARGHFMTVSLVVERAMAHRRGDLIGQHGCAMLDPLAGISAFAQLVEGKPFARTTVAAMPTQAAAR